MTPPTLGPCHVAKTGNHQRIIVEDGTGRNVAVVYDAKDADTLAAAPDMLHALEQDSAVLQEAAVKLDGFGCPNLASALRRMGASQEAAALKARGEDGRRHAPGCSKDCDSMPDGRPACATPIEEL